jgi:hypothetical protein
MDENGLHERPFLRMLNAEQAGKCPNLDQDKDGRHGD